MTFSNRPPLDGAAAPIVSLAFWIAALSAPPLAFGAPPWQARAVNSNVIATFRVTPGGERLLLLPTKIAGITTWGALDTGAVVSLYDRRLRSLLGQIQAVTQIETPQGLEMAELFKAPRPSVGVVTLSHDTGMVLCRDLNTLRDATKQEVAVILGMDVLRRSIVRIDQEYGTVSFLKKAGLDPATGTPLIDEGNGPSVTATLEGLGTHKFLIDTAFVGAGANMLSKTAFESLVRDGHLALGDDVMGIGVSGHSRRRKGVLKTAIVVGMARDSSVSFSEGSWNTLGLSYLSRYIVTLDFPAQLIYLQPRIRRTHHSSSPMPPGQEVQQISKPPRVPLEGSQTPNLWKGSSKPDARRQSWVTCRSK